MKLSNVPKRSFLIAQVDAEWKEDGLHIHIPDDPEVATDGASRQAMERDQSGKKRWPAGGVALILECDDATVLITTYRWESAQSYPGHEVVPSGLGDSEYDFVSPTALALRELLEEVLIVVDGRAMEYNFDNVGLNQTQVSWHTCETVAALGLNVTEHVGVETRFHFFDGDHDQDVRVHYLNQVFHDAGLIVEDPSTNGIDLIIGIRARLPELLADLAIYDGERGRDGKPYHRIVNAYELDRETYKPTGRILASWQQGKRIEVGERKPFTATTAAVWKALGGE